MDMSILQVHSTNTKLGVYAVKVSTLPKYKTIEKRNMIKKKFDQRRFNKYLFNWLTIILMTLRP